MNKLRIYFVPAAVFLLSLIITFGWSGILRWDTSANFVTALIFWILCVSCIVLSVVMLKAVRTEFPYKVAIVILDVIYYITFIGLVTFGIFSIPRMTFIFVHMLLLFLYLVVAVPLFIMTGSQQTQQLEHTEGE